MNYIFTLPKMLTTFVITIFIDDSLSMQLRIIINNIAKFMVDLFEPFISFRTYQYNVLIKNISVQIKILLYMILNLSLIIKNYFVYNYSNKMYCSKVIYIK